MNSASRSYGSEVSPMPHESPAKERGNPVGIGESGASRPLGPTRRRRPFRMIHLMMAIATVAVALTLTPFLMKVIEQPLAGWKWDERLYYQISLALTFWTPILALIAGL